MFLFITVIASSAYSRDTFDISTPEGLKKFVGFSNWAREEKNLIANFPLIDSSKELCVKISNDHKWHTVDNTFNGWVSIRIYPTVLAAHESMINQMCRSNLAYPAKTLDDVGDIAFYSYMNGIYWFARKNVVIRIIMVPSGFRNLPKPEKMEKFKIVELFARQLDDLLVKTQRISVPTKMPKLKANPSLKLTELKKLDKHKRKQVILEIENDETMNGRLKCEIDRSLIPFSCINMLQNEENAPKDRWKYKLISAEKGTFPFKVTFITSDNLVHIVETEVTF